MVKKMFGGGSGKPKKKPNGEDEDGTEMKMVEKSSGAQARAQGSPTSGGVSRSVARHSPEPGPREPAK